MNSTLNLVEAADIVPPTWTILVVFVALMTYLVMRWIKPEPKDTREIPMTRTAACRETDVDQWGCPHCGFMLGEMTEEFPSDHPVWGVWYCLNEQCNRQFLVVRDERIISGVTTIPCYGGMIREIEVIAHPRAGQRSWGIQQQPHQIRIVEPPRPQMAMVVPPPAATKSDPNAGGSELPN